MMILTTALIHVSNYISWEVADGNCPWKKLMEIPLNVLIFRLWLLVGILQVTAGLVQTIYWEQ